jgi:hypothetical protein
MADPGCAYKEPGATEPCGKTPSQMLAMGMTPSDPDKPSDPGHFLHAHYFEEHLPVVKRDGSAQGLGRSWLRS